MGRPLPSHATPVLVRLAARFVVVLLVVAIAVAAALLVLVLVLELAFDWY